MLICNGKCTIRIIPLMAGKTSKPYVTRVFLFSFKIDSGCLARMKNILFFQSSDFYAKRFAAGGGVALCRNNIFVAFLFFYFFIFYLRPSNVHSWPGMILQSLED